MSKDRIEAGLSIAGDAIREITASGERVELLFKMQADHMAQMEEHKRQLDTLAAALPLLCDTSKEAITTAQTAEQAVTTAPLHLQQVAQETARLARATAETTKSETLTAQQELESHVKSILELEENLKILEAELKQTLAPMEEQMPSMLASASMFRKVAERNLGIDVREEMKRITGKDKKWKHSSVDNFTYLVMDQRSVTKIHGYLHGQGIEVSPIGKVKNSDNYLISVQYSELTKLRAVPTMMMSAEPNVTPTI